MRRFFVAVSILGAVAGTAHAQSSVTLYGLLDEGLLFNTNAKTS
ncbi:porin [Paraburkholderia sp.]|jgi:predicted porin